METGLGDYGKQVSWGPDEEDAVKRSIKEFGFNMVMSDKISLDRVPKDIRDPKCKYVDYPEKLPEVSVVIVFHNEAVSIILRTVASVLNRTPKHLIKYISAMIELSINYITSCRVEIVGNTNDGHEFDWLLRQ